MEKVVCQFCQSTIWYDCFLQAEFFACPDCGSELVNEELWLDDEYEYDDAYKLWYEWADVWDQFDRTHYTR